MQAVIFVVDAADKLRIQVAKNELDVLLAHPCKYPNYYKVLIKLLSIAIK